MQFANPLTSLSFEADTFDVYYNAGFPVGGFVFNSTVTVGFTVPNAVRTLSVAVTITPGITPPDAASTFRVEIYGQFSNTVYMSKVLTQSEQGVVSNIAVLPFVENAPGQDNGLFQMRITQITGPTNASNFARARIVGYAASGAVQIANSAGQTLRATLDKSIAPPAKNVARGNVGPGNPLVVMLPANVTFGYLLHSIAAVCYGGGAGSAQGAVLRQGGGGFLHDLVVPNNTTAPSVTYPHGLWIPPNNSLRLEDSTVIIAGGVYVVVDISYSALTQAQFDNYFALGQ